MKNSDRKNTLLVLSKLINGVEKLEKFMSNLLKSKFLLGVMVVATLATAFAFAMFATTALADCSITSTLRVGSRGEEVKCLQTIVGATADGKFGPMTKAAVMALQSGKGLVADGGVGP